MSFIETERLLLRTWMNSDADAYLRVAGDPEVTRYMASGPIASLEDARKRIAFAMEEQDREGFSLWPVIRKDDATLIGRCGLHRLPEGEVEIAWLFERAVWGSGYATEASRAVLDYAFDYLKLTKVYALIDPLNAASIAVANRLRMRFDRLVRAYRRDLLRYVATP